MKFKKVIFINIILLFLLINFLHVEASSSKKAYRLETRQVAGQYNTDLDDRIILELSDLKEIYGEYGIDLNDYPQYLPGGIKDGNNDVIRWIYIEVTKDKFLYKKQVYLSETWVDTNEPLKYEGEQMTNTQNERWIENGSTQDFIIYEKQNYVEDERWVELNKESLLTLNNSTELISGEFKWTNLTTNRELYYEENTTKHYDQICLDLWKRNKGFMDFQPDENISDVCYYVDEAPGWDSDLDGMRIYYDDTLEQDKSTVANSKGFKHENGTFIYYKKDDTKDKTYWIANGFKSTSDDSASKTISKEYGWSTSKPSDKSGDTEIKYINIEKTWRDYNNVSHTSKTRYNNEYQKWEKNVSYAWDIDTSVNLKEEISNSNNTLSNQNSCAIDYKIINNSCYKIKQISTTERWIPTNVITKKVYKKQTLQNVNMWKDTDEEKYYFENDVPQQTSSTQWVKANDTDKQTWYQHKKQIFSVDGWNDLAKNQTGYEAPKYLNKKAFISSEKRLSLNSEQTNRYKATCQQVIETYDVPLGELSVYLAYFKSFDSELDQANWFLNRGNLTNKKITYGTKTDTIVLEGIDSSSVCYSKYSSTKKITYNAMSYPTKITKKYYVSDHTDLIGKTYNLQKQIGETTEWNPLLNKDNKEIIYVGFETPEINKNFIALEVDKDFNMNNYNEQNLRWSEIKDYDFTTINKTSDLFLFNPNMSFKDIMKNIDNILIWTANTLGFIFLIKYFIGFLFSGDDPGQKKSNKTAMIYVIYGLILVNIIGLIIEIVKNSLLMNR
ncbi:hypothetical protein KHQ81_15470 (plasmid) [Mycoplasmatota bacterium]|nr:hypothetical protein KHQ81_15470 [Mycoplasmatota bacterium]